ncbi:MAG: hypothetical protein J6J31_14195 [Thermoguttaceae bacterium]|nr:hypothetical protein [Thermoguttaceae bacterium]
MKYHLLWIFVISLFISSIEVPRIKAEEKPKNSITHQKRYSEEEAQAIFNNVRQKAVLLYQILEEFRKIDNFQEWGFAQNGPYYNWLKAVNLLRKKADEVTPFFPISEADETAFDPVNNQWDYSKMPLNWRITTGLTHLLLYGMECTAPTPDEIEIDRLKTEFLRCFFDSGTLEMESELQADEPKTESILLYNIQKIKAGSVKINRKWFKMEDDVLIGKFGWNGKEMSDLRKAASPKELEQNPQAVMMTGEMWEVWEQVKSKIEQRAKTEEFTFQKEPEECVFPIGPGLYCVEVPIRYTSKSGKKKETTLTFQVEVP